MRWWLASWLVFASVWCSSPGVRSARTDSIGQANSQGQETLANQPPFSATITAIDASGTQVSCFLAMNGAAYRLEIPQGIFLRDTKGECYQLYPDRKMYSPLSSPGYEGIYAPWIFFGDLIDDSEYQLEIKHVGTAIVGELACDKYELHLGGSTSAPLTLFAAKGLGSLVVRIEDPSATSQGLSFRSYVLSDIRINTIPSSLFELPKGYEPYHMRNP